MLLNLDVILSLKSFHSLFYAPAEEFNKPTEIKKQFVSGIAGMF